MEHLTLYDIECCREYYEQNFAHDYYMPSTETEQPEIAIKEFVRNLCETEELNEAQETIFYYPERLVMKKQSQQKPISQEELNSAAQKMDLKQAVRSAYRQILDDEMVRERIRTTVQLVQHEMIRERLEKALEEMVLLKKPATEMKPYEEAISYHKREEIKKYALLKEQYQVLSQESMFERIAKILEETSNE